MVEKITKALVPAVVKSIGAKSQTEQLEEVTVEPVKTKIQIDRNELLKSFPEVNFNEKRKRRMENVTASKFQKKNKMQGFVHQQYPVQHQQVQHQQYPVQQQHQQYPVQQQQVPHQQYPVRQQQVQHQGNMYMVFPPEMYSNVPQHVVPPMPRGNVVLHKKTDQGDFLQKMAGGQPFQGNYGLINSSQFRPEKMEQERHSSRKVGNQTFKVPTKVANIKRITLKVPHTSQKREEQEHEQDHLKREYYELIDTLLESGRHDKLREFLNKEKKEKKIVTPGKESICDNNEESDAVDCENPVAVLDKELSNDDGIDQESGNKTVKSILHLTQVNDEQISKPDTDQKEEEKEEEKEKVLNGEEQQLKGIMDGVINEGNYKTERDYCSPLNVPCPTS